MASTPNPDPYAGYDRKYDARSDQEWVKLILGSLKQITTPDGIKLVGACPRCKDEMDAFVPTAAEAGTYGFEERSVVVACNCRMPHENREAGTQGCGIYGKIDVQ
jgi:hypothetical protein